MTTTELIFVPLAILGTTVLVFVMGFIAGIAVGHQKGWRQGLADGRLHPARPTPVEAP